MMKKELLGSAIPARALYLIDVGQFPNLFALGKAPGTHHAKKAARRAKIPPAKRMEELGLPPDGIK